MEHGDVDESLGGFWSALIVLGEAALACEPIVSAFNNPALGLNPRYSRQS